MVVTGSVMSSSQEVNQVEGNGGNRRNGANEGERSNLENWLPITATRKANWWHSAFHNVTAMVGAGVLGLPFAMSQIGWYPGMIALLVSWLVTLYSLWQLVELHELVPGTRFDRYSELGKHVFGPRRGYWFIMPQQLSVQVCTNIVYMVTGGKSMMKFMSIVAPSLTWIRQTYYIMFFGFCQLVLSQTPDFNSLKGVSLLAAVMSFCYSAMACIACILKGVREHHHFRPNYGVRASTTVGIVFDVFNAIGTIAFSFAGHSVVLEIQATIPSTPEKPSNKPMWKGVLVAYYIVAFCYFSVAIAGFWAFGNVVDDDVLVSLQHPDWLIATANLMVFIHVLGSYQVFAMSVFDIIESTLVKKLNFSPGLFLRMSARSIYVALTCFTGVMVPFFGGLIGFIGGLFFAPISYSIPGMMWLRVHKPKAWSKHWIASWISIIVGTAILVFAPAGGLRTIILSYKTYKLFS